MLSSVLKGDHWKKERERERQKERKKERKKVRKIRFVPKKVSN